jgi:ABC-type uncharacterized transport system ATPase subunit
MSIARPGAPPPVAGGGAGLDGGAGGAGPTPSGAVAPSGTALPGAARDTLPLVGLRGITKIFPGVVANDGIDLHLYPGEIHCLLGENGAGKSTLMSILAGMNRLDAGSITIEGEVVNIGSPEDAIVHGVGMVYQHPTLVPTFTVLENLLLGARGGFRLDRKEALVSLRELAGRLGTDIDPQAVVGRLTLGRQQQVEIIKALGREPRILILDEPTAMLTPRETESLGKVLLALKAQGLAVVVITHKLREALSFGDRITVLKDGRVAGRFGPGELLGGDRHELSAAIVRMMFGEEATGPAGATGGLAEATELEEEPPVHECRQPSATSGEAVLRLDRVSVRPGPQEMGVREVLFGVCRGEVFGIAGVDGNGQRELAEAIAGQRNVWRGSLSLGDEDITHASVSARQRLGLGYVTDDQLGEGMVASLPLSLNLLLKRIGEQPFWNRARRMSPASIREAAESLAEEFDIRAVDVDAPGGTLSGGNIQKMLLARELSFAPKVVVYNKPTHGLDLKTTLAIRRRIRELATDDGVAAVLISTDLDELLALCDRIGVMFQGKLLGIVENAGPGVEEQVGALMLGGEGTAGPGGGEAA